jgi:hypothetical protein
MFNLCSQCGLIFSLWSKQALIPFGDDGAHLIPSQREAGVGFCTLGIGLDTHAWYIYAMHEF